MAGVKHSDLPAHISYRSDTGYVRLEGSNILDLNLMTLKCHPTLPKEILINTVTGWLIIRGEYSQYLYNHCPYIVDHIQNLKTIAHPENDDQGCCVLDFRPFEVTVLIMKCIAGHMKCFKHLGLENPHTFLNICTLLCVSENYQLQMLRQTKWVQNAALIQALYFTHRFQNNLKIREVFLEELGLYTFIPPPKEISYPGFKRCLRAHAKNPFPKFYRHTAIHKDNCTCLRCLGLKRRHGIYIYRSRPLLDHGLCKECYPRPSLKQQLHKLRLEQEQVHKIKCQKQRTRLMLLGLCLQADFL